MSVLKIRKDELYKNEVIEMLIGYYHSVTIKESEDSNYIIILWHDCDWNDKKGE